MFDADHITRLDSKRLEEQAYKTKQKYPKDVTVAERTSSDLINRENRKLSPDRKALSRNKFLIADRGGGCSFHHKGISPHTNT